MTKTLSRRKFIQATGITMGASALVLAGEGCTPAGEAAVEIETPSYTYGTGEGMNKRILIAYATRTGSTVGVASAIGETLGTRGFSVDVKPVNENPATDGYQAVVIGSAVNGAQWLPEAVEYVKTHQQALNQLPVALFCVHIMNTGADEKSQKNRKAYLNAVRKLVQPADEAYFAGMGMDPDEQAGFVRWIYRTFKIGGEGDCRDWDLIRGWGETVSLDNS